jgi:Family of unknown function (DUF7010)
MAGPTDFGMRVRPSHSSLSDLQDQIIHGARRGYPILITGSAFFLVLAAISRMVPLRVLGLIWIFGMVVIFPTGVALGYALKIRVMTRDNPLGTLGGLVAGEQAFFIPVFVVVYQFAPAYLPLAVGLLGGAHFLPYSWVYRSRAHVFVALATGLASLVAGISVVASAYTVVPMAISVIFAGGVLWILLENRRFMRSDPVAAP